MSSFEIKREMVNITPDGEMFKSYEEATKHYAVFRIKQLISHLGLDSIDEEDVYEQFVMNNRDELLNLLKDYQNIVGKQSKNNDE